MCKYHVELKKSEARQHALLKMLQDPEYDFEYKYKIQAHLRDEMEYTTELAGMLEKMSRQMK